MLLLWISLSLPSYAADAFSGTEDDVVALVRANETDVSAQRGLAFKRPVPVDVQTPAQMRLRMEMQFKEELEPAELEAATITLELLRLIPQGTDLLALYTDILEEQVGGYYDPKTGELFLIQRDDTTMPESMVVAHELVHALQDQHFDLQRLTDREYNNDDVLLAVQSLVEGDASYFMTTQLMAAAGNDIDTLNLGALEGMLSGAASEPDSALGRAPSILSEPMLFPYLHGMIFSQQVKIGGDEWSGIDAAFAAPPLSTEQILHPERYVGSSPDWPTLIELPDLAEELPGSRVLDTNVMGELSIRILLESSHLVHFAKAADGWDGDQYKTLMLSDGTPSLVWRSVWDSEDEASEFFESARLWAVLAFPDAAKEKLKGDSAIRKGATHSIAIVRRGANVAILIHTPNRAVSRVLDALFDAPTREVKTLDAIAPPKEPTEQGKAD